MTSRPRPMPVLAAPATRKHCAGHKPCARCLAALALPLYARTRVWASNTQA